MPDQRYRFDSVVTFYFREQLREGCSRGQIDGLLDEGLIVAKSFRDYFSRFNGADEGTGKNQIELQAELSKPARGFSHQVSSLRC